MMKNKETELEESVLTFLKSDQTAADMQNLMFTMVSVHRQGSGLVYSTSCEIIEKAYARNLNEEHLSN